MNRTIAMIEKYHGGVITKCDDMDALDRDVSTLAVQTAKSLKQPWKIWNLIKQSKTVWSFIGRMNKYIDETMPGYWPNLKMLMTKHACNLLCITWQKHCVSLQS